MTSQGSGGFEENVSGGPSSSESEDGSEDEGIGRTATGGRGGREEGGVGFGYPESLPLEGIPLPLPLARPLPCPRVSLSKRGLFGNLGLSSR